MKLAESHANVVQAVAAGLHTVPDVASSATAAQAAYRFLNNERVTLRALAEPLLECARHDVPHECVRFVRVVHDWSQLVYRTQHAKRDRRAQRHDLLDFSARVLTILAEPSRRFPSARLLGRWG